MANMSYCKFRNTLSDVEDCIETLNNEHISSREEKDAAKKLLKVVLEYCEENDIIVGYDPSTILDVIDGGYGIG